MTSGSRFRPSSLRHFFCADIISFERDEARIRDRLGEMVRGTVEEALNAMLDAEADRLCGASKYVSIR